MPESDIPEIILSKDWIAYVSKSMPELPDTTKARLLNKYNLSLSDINVLYKHPNSISFFEQTVDLGADIRKTFSWITSEIFGILNYHGYNFESNIAVSPVDLYDLITATEKSEITTPVAKKILILKFDGNTSTIHQIAKSNNWLNKVVDSSELVTFCQKVIAENEKKADEYKSTFSNPKNNCKRILNSFVGLAIKKSGSSQAKPQQLVEIFKELLKN
ncbi:Glutamyl-tRNA(Gln) amidotransferase subunit B, chloroplastic/mitochondrial [Smittium culicis]|uniref:Glutamyl-tRNA(Gln) amidotransferase subunit B, chloroplastic/mitochondrial n=1 Tax=Smittium culicis TaxID=133412 RepID=A0A1R1YMF7_9FUNG|nr:Glutamyl-tRNA(Gln) amidotransferase subunit B, chloroplastic/mitochondrial [Smittium culicis]OMJ28005.1 Glutamyl-tRNA(Gln) amidotransferase subunit B, chloroplastic/mitochondrial [Smittium culicis]